MTQPSVPSVRDAGATLVVLGAFREGYEPHFAEYSARVRRYLDRLGARVIRRQRVEATLHGRGTATLVMVIDMPSRAAARRVLLDPEYLAIVPLREKVFRDFQMYLAEPGDI